MHQTPWGLVTKGRVIPAKGSFAPVSDNEIDWFARMQEKGLAQGYEILELVLDIHFPIPPFCRSAQRQHGRYPDMVTRSTRPDLCLVEGNRLLFTELKSSEVVHKSILEVVWKLLVAREAIQEYQIDFLLVFTGGQLVYSSLPEWEVKRILHRIGEDPKAWDIKSTADLQDEIITSFPQRYPQDATGQFNYEAQPIAS